MPRWSRLIVVLVMVTFLGAARMPGLRIAPSSAVAEAATRTDEPVSVTLRISGIDLGSRARYAVTLQRPLDAAITKAQLSVQLPAGADLAEVAQPAGRASFEGHSDSVLTWTIAEVAAGEPAPVLSFSLAAPTSGRILASLTHDGALDAVEAEFTGELVLATSTEAEVALPATGEFVAAGDTGVLLAVASGDGAGAMVRVRRLGPDANPAAADLPRVWWCALVAIDGLPAGVTLSIVAPARQPLPPDASLLVFERGEGSGWAALTDAATVTPDGQFITFSHAGGLRATGTTPRNQPVAQAAIAAATGADPAAISVTFNPAGPIASGTNTTLSALVRNVGSVAAPQGTNVNFTLETGLAIQAIPAQEVGVVCAQSGPQLATCTLPALNAQASKTITLTVRGTNTGTAAVMLCADMQVAPNITSDNPANNDVTGCITVVPATGMQADLQVVSVAAAAPSIDTSTTAGGRTDVAAAIRNNGPNASATGVTVTFTLAAGITLAAQQPSQPTGVSCTATGATRTCTLPALTAGQTVSPTITIRGTTPGASRCVTVQLAGGASDPVAGNNSGQACVAVTDPPPAPLDVSVKLERTAGQLNPGETVTYHVTARVETGVSTALFGVSFFISGDFEVVALTAPGWNCATLGNVTAPSRLCSITSTITAPNSYPVIEIQARLRGCVPISLGHQAILTVSGDTNNANNQTLVGEQTRCTRLELTITQSDDILSVQFRDRQTWNISVRNIGGGPTTGAITLKFKAIGILAITNWIEADAATPCSLDDPGAAGLVGTTGTNRDHLDVTCTLTQVIQPGASASLPAISARISPVFSFPGITQYVNCSQALADLITGGDQPKTRVTVSGGGAPDVTRELPFKIRICGFAFP
jgi:hypothetical protein